MKTFLEYLISFIILVLCIAAFVGVIYGLGFMMRDVFGIVFKSIDGKEVPLFIYGLSVIFLMGLVIVVGYLTGLIRGKMNDTF